MNDLILMAALLDGPKHGWVLKKLGGWVTGHGDMHNNLVYPAMKKFVTQGWVRRRAEAGHRGQTRAVYSLTPIGNKELFRRLNQFGEKEAASATEFRLRVGLFGVLTPETRKRILAERTGWLAAREERFEALRQNLTAMGTAPWGLEVVNFLTAEIQLERKWIAALERKSGQQTNSRSNSRSNPRKSLRR
jgi:DNA-binding PadR family transcriptional regulator